MQVTYYYAYKDLYYTYNKRKVASINEYKLIEDRNNDSTQEE